MNLYLDEVHDLVFEAEIASPGTERILIKAGSEASVSAVKADGDPYVDRKNELRQKLIDEGTLVPHLRHPHRLIFARDYEFRTPGAAAEVLLGKNKSARTVWRDVKSKRSLFEMNGSSR